MGSTRCPGFRPVSSGSCGAGRGESLRHQEDGMARNTGAVGGDTDRRKRRKRRWPWILLAIFVLIALIAVVLFALGWLTFDFTGGNIDAPSVDVDTDLPAVHADSGDIADWQ